MKKKKVTMQEIADMLGVSKVSVSKALNGKDGVGQELRQKILKAAGEYGYHLPVKTKAESSAGKKIVVICDDKFFGDADKSYFYVRIYKQITVELAKRGCIASLLTVRNEEGCDNLRAFLSSQHFDGILLLGELDESVLKMTETMTAPKLFVDSDKGIREGDSVLIENFYSTYSITKYLLDNGHREIGFVGSIGVTQSIRDRFLGYCRAMIEYRLPINQEWLLEDRTEKKERVEIIVPGHLPTAFVCNCDATAHGLVQQLKAKNIRIPEDVSIVSFDDDSFAQICIPPLTTIAVNVKNMAESAVTMILERIENPEMEKNRIRMVDGSIVYRDSVRKLE